MKQLDWKSFAIGVLPTTTVMFGTGAATSTTTDPFDDAVEKWDADQQWIILGRPETVNGNPGYEPFQMIGNHVLWRKRIK
jgi:hypothetical protein